VFDVASSELMLFVLVALLVIGPKDLPYVRGVAAHFRSGFDEMIRQSELEELEKKWKSENERIMREHPADPRADVLGDDSISGEAGPPVEQTAPNSPPAEMAPKV
jgi:sec-independent protein translocase protein TatB